MHSSHLPYSMLLVLDYMMQREYVHSILFQLKIYLLIDPRSESCWYGVRRGTS